MPYTVQVIRSSRRTLALEVKADGSILVRAPMRLGMPKIRAFVAEQSAWIEKQLQKRKTAQAVPRLSPEELDLLRKEAAILFPARAAIFASMIGVDYGKLSIRCQKTKWGSCSAKGNLNFNVLLMLAPPEVLDYVVVHELCHRKEMNHSERFWSLVEQVLPDYRARRKWLKDHGGELMSRVY